MKKKEVKINHDLKSLDEVLDSKEFKNEVDNYKYDKSESIDNGVNNEDLVEYHKNILASYGL